MQKVYSQIIQIAGDVITVEAEDIGYKELAEVCSSMGSSLAQVIRLEGKKGIAPSISGKPRHID